MRFPRARYAVSVQAQARLRTLRNLKIIVERLKTDSEKAEVAEQKLFLGEILGGFTFSPQK